VSRFKLRPPLLCLITDPTLPDLAERVGIALSAGVNMLQLRGHQVSAAHLYQLAAYFRPLCQRYGAVFIVNDRLDVGLAVQADGFQLGIRSLPLTVARQVVGEEALLGASVHSSAEARAAVETADYLMVGSIFASQSHPGETPAGPGLIREIKQTCPSCLILAIGGITPANARCVMAAGASGVAVISAILEARDIRYTVCTLRAAIDV